MIPNDRQLAEDIAAFYGNTVDVEYTHQLIRRELGLDMPVEAGQIVQTLRVSVEGPGTEPKPMTAFFTTPAQPRTVFDFELELPNLWPEDVRSSVLQFLSEIAEQDAEAKARANDETSKDIEDRVRDQVIAEMEQMGWLPPEELQNRLARAYDATPNRLALFETTERAQLELDPALHNFYALTVPGLTHRCAFCGKAKQGHPNEEPLPEGDEHT